VNLMEINWELPLRSDGISLEIRDLTVTVRPIRDDDDELLQAVFRSMSPRSRYLRFFTMAKELNAALARSLAEIDHDTHWAWLVFDPASPSDVGSDEGLGVAVARIVGLTDEPEVAEAAVAVLDDYHGRGIGQVLLQLLTSVAVRSGVKYLRFEVLAENRGMRELLKKLDARLNSDLSDHTVLIWDVPVAAEADSETMGAVYEILRWIAASDESEKIEPGDGVEPDEGGALGRPGEDVH